MEFAAAMSDPVLLALIGLAGILINNLTNVVTIVIQQRQGRAIAHLHTCVETRTADLSTQITQDVIPAVATVAEVAARIEEKQS